MPHLLIDVLQNDDIFLYTRTQGNSTYNFFVDNYGRLKAIVNRRGAVCEVLTINGLEKSWQINLRDPARLQKLILMLKQCFFSNIGSDIWIHSRGLGGHRRERGARDTKQQSQQEKQKSTKEEEEATKERKQEDVKHVPIPDECKCPISSLMMFDPVLASDGETYEREEIERWLKEHDTSPLHHEPFVHKNLTPNRAIKRQIDGLLEKHSELWDSGELYFSSRLVQNILSSLQENDIETLKRLLDQDRRLLTRPLKGNQTLLHLACMQSPTVLNLVLRRLGDLFVELAKKDDGLESFCLAARYLGAEGALLVAKALNWKQEHYQRQLLSSIKVGDVQVISVCLDLGADVDAADQEGNTPLHHAVLSRKNSRTVIELLLRRDVNVKACNQERKRASDIARDTGWDNIAILIETQQHALKLAPYLQPLQQQLLLLQQMIAFQATIIGLLPQEERRKEKQKPPEGLVSWWSMQDTFQDQVGSNHPKQIGNMTYVDGKVGKGIKMGEKGCLEIPHTDTLGNQRFSIEIWVKPEGAGPNSTDFYGSLLIGQPGITTLYWNSQTLKFGFHLQGEDAVYSDSMFLPGSFYHFLATYDGGKCNIYINGNLESEALLINKVTYLSTPWYIGGWTHPDHLRTFNGIISTVRIYDRALAPEEVSSLHRHPDASYQPKKSAGPSKEQQTQMTQLLQQFTILQEQISQFSQTPSFSLSPDQKKQSSQFSSTSSWSPVFMPPQWPKPSVASEDDTNERWYSNDDIHALLKHYIGHFPKVNVLDAMDAYYLKGTTLIENMYEEQIQQVLKKSAGELAVDTVVIPINLGHLHWAALYIHYTSQDQTRPIVGYFDPKGDHMPEQVSNAIKAVYPNVQAGDILESRIQLQHDDYNCGPWVIAILESLVTSNGEHLPAQDFDIDERRRQDQAVLERQSTAQYQPM